MNFDELTKRIGGWGEVSFAEAMEKLASPADLESEATLDDTEEDAEEGGIMPSMNGVLSGLSSPLGIAGLSGAGGLLAGYGLGGGLSAESQQERDPLGMPPDQPPQVLPPAQPQAMQPTPPTQNSVQTAPMLSQLSPMGQMPKLASGWMDTLSSYIPKSTDEFLKNPGAIALAGTGLGALGGAATNLLQKPKRRRWLSRALQGGLAGGAIGGAAGLVSNMDSVADYLDKGMKQVMPDLPEKQPPVIEHRGQKLQLTPAEHAEYLAKGNQKFEGVEPPGTIIGGAKTVHNAFKMRQNKLHSDGSIGYWQDQLAKPRGWAGWLGGSPTADNLTPHLNDELKNSPEAFSKLKEWTAMTPEGRRQAALDFLTPKPDVTPKAPTMPGASEWLKSSPDLVPLEEQLREAMKSSPKAMPAMANWETMPESGKRDVIKRLLTQAAPPPPTPTPSPAPPTPGMLDSQKEFERVLQKGLAGGYMKAPPKPTASPADKAWAKAMTGALTQAPHTTLAYNKPLGRYTHQRLGVGHALKPLGYGLLFDMALNALLRQGAVGHGQGQVLDKALARQSGG